MRDGRRGACALVGGTRGAGGGPAAGGLALHQGQRIAQLLPHTLVLLALQRIRSAPYAPLAPPIRPSAQAACPRTSGSASSERANQRRNRDGIADVAQRDADVAQQPTSLGALDRAVAKALAKALLVQREQRNQRGARRIRSAWLELQPLAFDAKLARSRADGARPPRSLGRPAGRCRSRRCDCRSAGAARRECCRATRW